MLSEGCDRLLDKGLVANVTSLQVNAEKLPFNSGQMDCVTIAFGLRNVTDKQTALNEMARVTKPGWSLPRAGIFEAGVEVARTCL